MLLQQLISNGIHVDISIPKARLSHLSVKPPECHPAFQEYYDPIMAPAISEELTILMEREYEQLFQDKMQEIQRYLSSRQQTLQKHLNSRFKFQEIKQLRLMNNKKNDLIEQHILLDAQIQSEERQIRIIEQRVKYRKQAENIMIQQQIDQINTEYDRLTEQFIEQIEHKLQQEYDLLKRQQIVKALQKPVQHQTDLKNNTAAIWNQYYLKSKQIKEHTDEILKKQSDFIRQLSQKYQEENTKIELDFKKTLKMYEMLPTMPQETEMLEQLEMIKAYKKKYDRDGKKEDKRKLKEAMEIFERMRQLRQKLKKTLKF